MEIVREEMRRVLATLARKASDWRLRGEMSATWIHEGLDGEGHCAYAHQQADMLEQMAASFNSKWVLSRRHADSFLLSHDIPPELERLLVIETEVEQNTPAAEVGDRDWQDEDLWGV